MPPKTKKDQEQEALRLAEEQRIKEEEERILREAEKKFRAQTLDTGLLCVLTEYYVTECLLSQDPKRFTLDFIQRWLKEQAIENQFRKIDFDILSQFHVDNLRFASCDMGLDTTTTYVLLNIFWQVYRQGDKRYEPLERQSGVDDETFNDLLSKHTLSSQKVKEEDSDLLKQLLKQHSQQNAIYFKPEQLKKIISYFVSSYFANFNLYTYVMQHDQRFKDTYQTVYINEPTLVANLEVSQYIQDENNRDIQLIQEENLDNQDEDDQGIQQEQEEELDPLSLQILREKIREAEEDINQKLDEREKQLEQKIEEATAPKGKKGK